MNVATVLDSSWPFFMIRRHRGMISVCMRKLMASESSPFTNAPITPRLVTLRFSNDFYLFEVLRKGYKNRGIWAINIFEYLLSTFQKINPDLGVQGQALQQSKHAANPDRLVRGQVRRR